MELTFLPNEPKALSFGIRKVCKRPCKKQCIFSNHHVEIIITSLLVYDELRLKKTATDPYLYWCWWLVLGFFCLLSRKKSGVNPEKGGKMALFECSEIK